MWFAARLREGEPLPRITKSSQGVHSPGAPGAVLSGSNLFAAPFSHEKTLGYSRNDYVFLQHEPARKIYLVREGTVSLIAMTEAGREVEVAVIVAGELFGFAALCRQAHPMSARALTMVTVAACSAERMWAQMVRDPALARSVMSSLASRWCLLAERVPELCCRTSQERLAMFLLCSMNGATAPIPLPHGSHVRLACHLGMQQETLSRAIRHLEKLAMIRAVPGGIAVLDADRLKEFAEGVILPTHS